MSGGDLLELNTYEYANHLVCITCVLKTVDTIGNCQNPVFSLGVSQHMHKVTNLGRQTCEIITKEITPLSHEIVCSLMLDFETSNSKLEVSKSNSSKITSFSRSTSL